MMATRDSLQIEGQMHTESEGMEKGIHGNGNERKLEQQYSYQTKDFKIKTVTRDNIKIKGSIHKEDVTIINIHVPNIRTP